LVGDIRGHGLCIVDGNVRGSVETADVKINSHAEVDGSVKCTRLDVNGRISGTIEAQDVVLRSSARIDGYLFYSQMSMEAGAQIDGEVRLLKNRGNSIGDSWVEFQISEEISSLFDGAQTIKLSYSNGDAAPAWMRIIDKKFQIKKDRMGSLENDGRIPMITIDSQSFLINLPTQS
jgi:cytoskeletal protein CcmA (bactofilin family)